MSGWPLYMGRGRGRAEGGGWRVVGGGEDASDGMGWGCHDAEDEQEEDPKRIVTTGY